MAIRFFEKRETFFPRRSGCHVQAKLLRNVRQNVDALPKLKEKCLAYENAFVFTTKHDIEDSFDIEGMGEAREKHGKIENELLSALQGQTFLFLGAGACNVCKTCTYPTAPCRFPDRARTSMEACGINVVELAKEVGINYVNGQNTVTYFSLILY